MNDDIGQKNTMDGEPTATESEVNETAEPEIESESAAGEMEAEVESESAAGEAEIESEPVAGETEAEAGSECIPDEVESEFRKEEPDDAEDAMDDDEEDWDEDAQPVKPWAMTLVFLGLIAAAAVICAVFWNVTHADKPDDEAQDTLASVQATDVPEETAPPEKSNQVVTKDGRVFEFKECDDYMTPKEYVNLRTEPSVEQGDATVSCTLNAGQVVHRTGDSGEMGWSRVEYNGQVLYVITSNMNVVKE